MTSAAYTNSFAGTTATTLFDIDASTGTLVVQNPPNNGTLQTVGALGVLPIGDTGLDIVSFGGNNAAVAVIRVGGNTGLYNVDLTSGAATLVGNIPGNPALVGLAVSATELALPAVNVPVPVDSRLALFLMAFGVILLGGMGLRRARR